jgi:N-acetylglucosamine kinase-like BadF-type ATPase
MAMTLGIDGGGTKTVAVVVDPQGAIRGRGTAGPSNYDSIGLDKSVKAISAAANEAIRDAGSNDDVGTAVLGIAGIDCPLDEERMLAALGSAGFLHNADVAVTNDAHIALVGAVGSEYGVALIAGTGAISYGINSAGRTARADGWGNVLGDEGSGYWIGSEALRAVLRAADGRGMPTILTGRLLKRLAMGRAPEILDWVHHGVGSVEGIAALAPAVFLAAAEGDRVARGIVSRAGHCLGRTVRAVIGALKMDRESFPLVTLGGLFASPSANVIADVVRRHVERVTPSAEWRVPRFPPEIGAVLLAFLRAGGVSAGTMRTLRSTAERMGHIAASSCMGEGGGSESEAG